MGGGLSGRGAGAGVVGGDVANVLTKTSEDPECSSMLNVETVVATFCTGVLCRSLVEKSNKQAMASKSISSSLSSFSNLCLMFLKKGETEWGRMVPLLPVEEEEEEAEP